MLSVVQECLCGWTRRWNSQPFIGSYPAGNLDISTGILFSGLNFGVVSELWWGRVHVDIL